MPHMPDYKCTPPKGGGKIWVIFILAIVVVAGAKVGETIAHYFVYVLWAAGIITTAVLIRLGYNVRQALKARTWHIEDASVMSKHDAEQRIYYGGRFPLDGGTVIQGRVIEGDVNSAYPREITEGNREGASGLPTWRESTRSGSQRSGPTRRKQSTWPTLRQNQSDKPERPEQ